MPQPSLPYFSNTTESSAVLSRDIAVRFPELGFDVTSTLKNSLDIEFDVTFSAGAAVAIGYVTIKNIPTELVGLINRYGQAIEIWAGYDKKLSVVFAGLVRWVDDWVEPLQGRITKIHVTGGDFINPNGVFSKTFNKGATPTQVLDEVVGLINSTLQRPLSILTNELSKTPFSTPQTFIGNLPSILLQLSQGSGCSYFLQSGYINIIKSNSTINQTISLTGHEICDSIVRKENLNISCKVLLDTRISLYHRVTMPQAIIAGNSSNQILAELAAQKQTQFGTFRIISVTHHGASRQDGNTWYTGFTASQIYAQGAAF